MIYRQFFSIENFLLKKVQNLCAGAAGSGPNSSGSATPGQTPVRFIKKKHTLRFVNINEILLNSKLEQIGGLTLMVKIRKLFPLSKSWCWGRGRDKKRPAASAVRSSKTKKKPIFLFLQKC
jgi:hypothetical protein